MFDLKRFEDLLQAHADANYDCGAYIKGITETPFPDLVDKAMQTGKDLQDYITEAVKEL